MGRGLPHPRHRPAPAGGIGAGRRPAQRAQEG